MGSRDMNQAIKLHSKHLWISIYACAIRSNDHLKSQSLEKWYSLPFSFKNSAAKRMRMCEIEIQQMARLLRGASSKCQWAFLRVSFGRGIGSEWSAAPT